MLEGEWRPQRLVLLEFEDLDAAQRWYDSPEYRDARALREGAANLSMVAVDGCRRTAGRAGSTPAAGC